MGVHGSAPREAPGSKGAMVDRLLVDGPGAAGGLIKCMTIWTPPPNTNTWSISRGAESRQHAAGRKGSPPRPPRKKNIMLDTRCESQRTGK